MTKKLNHLDIAYNLVRHTTRPGCQSFLRDVEALLNTQQACDEEDVDEEEEGVAEETVAEEEETEETDDGQSGPPSRDGLPDTLPALTVRNTFIDFPDPAATQSRRRCNSLPPPTPG